MGILGFLAALILAVLFGYFALLNQGSVTLNFGPLIAPQHAFLHEIAGYSAVVGALFSGFLALGPLFNSSRARRALRHQVHDLEKQVKSLREAAGLTALYSDHSSLVPTAADAAVARGDEQPV